MFGFLRLLHHEGRCTTRSNMARQNAEEVACAASMGLITTQLPDGSFGNVWRLTAAGLDRLAQGHYYA